MTDGLAFRLKALCMPEGNMLNVFKVHLHPTDENLRELDSLARTVEPYKNEPTIVMGDFNCNYLIQQLM